jgi:predicted aspartyl protease
MIKTSIVVLVICVAAAAAALTLRSQGSQSAPPPTLIDVPEQGVSLPMKDFGGRPVVDVRIGDKGPYAFILDTGASISVLDLELQKEMSLPSPHGVHAGTPGTTAPPLIVTVPSLQVERATIGGFMAAVMPLADYFKTPDAPRGVLSAASFPGCLVVFDYPGKRITINRGSLPAADANTIFQYGDDQTLPALPLRIAGQETLIHLDTGSGSTLTLPRKFLETLRLKSKPADSGVVRLLGGTSSVSVAAVDGEIAIGAYKLEIPEVRFSDVRLGPEFGPGNIGYPILKDFVVTLDSKNRRVRLVR